MTGFNSKRKMAKDKLPDDDDTQVYADTLLIVYQRGFADGKRAAQPEQEQCIGKDPRCPCQDGDACHYKDCVDTKARTVPLAQPEQEPVAYYHPHKGFYWAKPTHISAPTVVDVPPIPLYVKWIAAQRPWQGLTEEDWVKIGDMPDTWDQGAAWAAARLKAKNGH